MIAAYYATLEDIGYLLRNRRRRKAYTLREIEKAFKDEEIAPYHKRATAYKKRDKYQ